MAEYYLISQLPSLDGISENMMPPISEEKFLELCQESLGKNTFDELKKLKLTPARQYEKSKSGLISDWNEGERNLRLVLGKARADKMNKNFDSEGLENKSYPAGLVQAVRTATEMENPMEAEKFLNNYRLEFLESLRPIDNFSEDFLFYYWLKLKLILRIRKFDPESGREAYKNIYGSIMNGDRLEAIQ
jgi:hypothetical protein